jgi:hypothetical protein
MLRQSIHFVAGVAPFGEQKVGLFNPLALYIRVARSLILHL